MLHLLMEHESQAYYSFPIPRTVKSALDEFLAVFRSLKEVSEPFETEVDLDNLDVDLDDDDDLEDDEEIVQGPEIALSGNINHISTSFAIQRALQKLLFSLYAQLPEEDIKGNFSSVLMRYIVLCSCGGKGKAWQPSGVITKYFAMLLFCGRLTMFSEMELHRDKEGVVNYSK